MDAKEIIRWRRIKSEVEGLLNRNKYRGNKAKKVEAYNAMLAKHIEHCDREIERLKKEL